VYHKHGGTLSSRCLLLQPQLHSWLHRIRRGGQLWFHGPKPTPCNPAHVLWANNHSAALPLARYLSLTTEQCQPRALNLHIETLQVNLGSCRHLASRQQRPYSTYRQDTFHAGHTGAVRLFKVAHFTFDQPCYKEHPQTSVSCRVHAVCGISPLHAAVCSLVCHPYVGLHDVSK
jgi:hypothetical protein